MIEQIYRVVQLLINKSQSGGYLSPDQFNRLLELAQIDEINNLYLNKAEDVTEIDELSPVISDPTFINVVSGQATKPTDFLHYVTSRSYNFNEGYETPIEIIREIELGERMKSVIEQPSTDYPIIVEYSDYFTVYPASLNGIRLTYIIDPPTPNWAFTLVNQRPVYDASNSTDVLLTNKSFGNLVYRVCELFGIHVREGDLYNATKTELNELRKQ